MSLIEKNIIQILNDRIDSLTRQRDFLEKKLDQIAYAITHSDIEHEYELRGLTIPQGYDYDDLLKTIERKMERHFLEDIMTEVIAELQKYD